MRGYAEAPGQGQGFVNWPVPRLTTMENTGEGGLATYLLLPERDEEGDDWAQCAIDMPRFKVHGVVVRGQQDIERKLWGYSQYDEPYQDRKYSQDLVLAMCIGSTGASWCDDASGYFKPRYGDLTMEGQALYNLLAALYGREPYILTLLDT